MLGFISVLDTLSCDLLQNPVSSSLCFCLHPVQINVPGLLWRSLVRNRHEAQANSQDSIKNEALSAF